MHWPLDEPERKLTGCPQTRRKKDAKIMAPKIRELSRGRQNYGSNTTGESENP
jgi:hypothetical protein